MGSQGAGAKRNPRIRGTMGAPPSTNGRVDKVRLECLRCGAGDRSKKEKCTKHPPDQRMGRLLRSPPATRTRATNLLDNRMGKDYRISYLDVAVFNRPIPNSEPNKSVLQMVQAKLYNTIEITSRAVTPMGQLIAGPYGTIVRLDNGFGGFPTSSQPPATTIAEQINPSLIDQMCPRGSLPIQTRDDVFGILHTRSVYSDTVPRTLPGIRERTMVAGGSIEWESTENSETTDQDHPADAGTKHPEPSPEPTPDLPLAQPSSPHEEDRTSEGTNSQDALQQNWGTGTFGSVETEKPCRAV